MELEKYSSIQSNIDSLYKTAWFQPNACFPTNLFYKTVSYSSGADGSLSALLGECVNVKPLSGTSLSKNIDTSTSVKEVYWDPKSIKDFVNLEKQCVSSNAKQSEAALRQFVKITGLDSPGVPLNKDNGGLIVDKDTKIGGKNNCTLFFLCDRSFEVLKFLQAWQSKWITFDYEKKSLSSHAYKDEDSKEGKGGGEGFLGLTNVNIDTDGNITELSHVAVFGLIPKKIKTPFNTGIGPQASNSSLPMIEVECLYSQAILAIPMGKDKRLRYYYFA